MVITKNIARNKRRNDNYRKLRAAGFSAKDATRFKNYSRSRVESLIYKRTTYNQAIHNITNKQVF